MAAKRCARQHRFRRFECAAGPLCASLTRHASAGHDFPFFPRDRNVQKSSADCLPIALAHALGENLESERAVLRLTDPGAAYARLIRSRVKIATGGLLQLSRFLPWNGMILSVGCRCCVADRVA
ncbi:MAG: hypothetical protein R3D62_09565 [Xanthobacteraceae bacterium]